MSIYVYTYLQRWAEGTRGNSDQQYWIYWLQYEICVMYIPNKVSPMMTLWNGSLPNSYPTPLTQTHVLLVHADSVLLFTYGGLVTDDQMKYKKQKQSSKYCQTSSIATPNPNT